ncbi:polynucleotide phosphorylase/polyadenylase [Anaplasma phagocytophilum str. MRK]|uniref:polyribonucleotide nucleotidyltransferase n=1 Tax=Anaplasma phagocytophilum TaxID=948 RepID=UPI000533989E|nr:polyribonucleotide nucleotidyltransferase [Anaplasma phagocytophilum]KDB56014.1 polynucleotide phosphorylase/polyadenylase [Anaplasma phagocytophilum str. MRK]
MFDITRKCVEWGDRSLTIESGKIARQAGGAVVVDYGGTSVLATVVSQKSKEAVDFLPLTVQFLAKSYAVGKIPGGFFKREGKPSDRETLISRIIDRSIRPLFPSGFSDEVAVVCNLLSYDASSPPETVALIGASAALAISGIPFHCPVAGARIGYIKGEGRYILNPSADELSVSALDMFYARTDTSILMVESEAHELTEAEMLGALQFGHEHCEEIIKVIGEFAEEARKCAPAEFVPCDLSAIIDSIGSDYKERFLVAYSEKEKKARVAKLDAVRASLTEDLRVKFLSESEGGSKYIAQDIVYAMKTFERSLVRERVLESKSRIDGRAYDQIRNIEIEVDLISKAHGSALFTRGDTQALVITALGTPQDEQIVDGFDGDKRERFLLHYNFPPYAVGEASALRPPGRREIGHGKLAWRAIHPVLPSKADFPYTIRVVSEITESDGSSSMATVCGASLALMDTGVPLKSSVAGIAMGLIKEGDRYAILSDILGDEDYLGDMDFKVAGTREGITALQMDMKVKGIDFAVLGTALDQAKEGRFFIIEKMDRVIKESRGAVREHVPRMESMLIDKGKIKNVIGAGGKNVREICEKTGAKIEISQDGTVMIYAVGREAIESAKDMITGIVSEPEVGKIYSGEVCELAKYGAFVTFLGARKGLVHISEIRNEHINAVADVLAVGDKVKVLVIDMDKDHIQLSMRRIDQETGDQVDCELYAPQRRNGVAAGNTVGDGSVNGVGAGSVYVPRGDYGGASAGRNGRGGGKRDGAAKSSSSAGNGGGRSSSSTRRRHSAGSSGYSSDSSSGNTKSSSSESSGGTGGRGRNGANGDVQNGPAAPKKPRFF